MLRSIGFSVVYLRIGSDVAEQLADFALCKCVHVLGCTCLLLAAVRHRLNRFAHARFDFRQHRENLVDWQRCFCAQSSLNLLHDVTAVVAKTVGAVAICLLLTVAARLVERRHVLQDVALAVGSVFCAVFHERGGFRSAHFEQL